jgi:ABC-type multidrug transport system fused ATPase/permease subunit
LFSVFVSLLETIGISIIMPFISVASNFGLVTENQYFNWLYDFFSFEQPVNFVIAFGVVLIFFYLFRSAINLLYFYALTRFAQGRYHLLAYRLLENYLGMSYRQFIDKNTSELNKAILTEANNLTAIISSVLLMLSEVFVVIFIYSMMLYMNWKITLLITLLLVLNALLLVLSMSKKIKTAGHIRETHQKKFFQIIGNSFGNFKMIKLRGTNDKILSEFYDASHGIVKASIVNGTVAHFPRLFLEAVGFSIVIFIVIYLVYKYESDISNTLALISMFILGLYRLMPSANRILSAYNQILYNRVSLDIVHNDLMYDVESLGNEEIQFVHAIQLNNIYFEFLENHPIINNLDLVIRKKDKIAFIGESGSGKSTLVDIIIGLYKPKAGTIFVDNVPLSADNIKQWRQKVGYIPQSVYLFDGTVAENVAYGSKFNADKVKTVLSKANILSFLQNNHQGIETSVGEGGIKLSGGQKQRIAIARALYTDPELLILDEATSALDSNTESRIMDEIYKLCADKTLIIIAHRLSTITGCNKVYELRDQDIVLKEQPHE